MNLRSLAISLLALVLWTSVGEAAAQQQPAKIPVVGVLVTHAPLTDPVMESIRAGMRALGYEDGRNIKWDFVTAEGQLDRLPGLAEELVRRKVDVILAPNDLSARIAMTATSTIPIVMVSFTSDPVKSGLIASLNRPGGNLTGIYSLIADIQAKQLEILKEAVPRLTKVAIFRDPSFKDQLDQITDAAKILGLKTEIIEVQASQELEKAFKLARQKKTGAILFMSSPVFYVNRERVASLARAAKLPGITGMSQIAEEGILLSYGNDVDAIYQRTGYYLDRILKGTAPRDLPVEQVTKLTLTANFKTAKALGIKFPESILIRVDKAVR